MWSGICLRASTFTIEGNPIIEIGGADQVSYREIMREYACQRGLRRLMLVVPVLTPRLSSLWLGLVTPLYARVGRRMIDSIRHPTVVSDASALRMFRIRPRGSRGPSPRRCAMKTEKTDRNTMVQRVIGCRGPGGTGVVYASAAAWWIPGWRKSVLPQRWLSRPFRRIGGRTSWCYGRGCCGSCVDLSICWWEVWAFAEDAEIPSGW